MDLHFAKEIAELYDSTPAFIEKRHREVQQDLQQKGDCLIYTGYKNRYGYAFSSIAGRARYIHRFFLMAAKGPPPADKPFAVRSCRERACCNPEHLYWASQKDRLKHRKLSKKQQFHKLTREDVLTIRRLAEEGVPQVEIAEEFPVTPQTISKVVNYKSHKRVK